MCPDDAVCNFPGRVCKSDQCAPPGFLVPDNGNWHSSFFSEQVIECPNPDACTVDNRTNMLAELQQQIWRVGCGFVQGRHLEKATGRCACA